MYLMAGTMYGGAWCILHLYSSGSGKYFFSCCPQVALGRCPNGLDGQHLAFWEAPKCTKYISDIKCGKIYGHCRTVLGTRILGGGCVWALAAPPGLTLQSLIPARPCRWQNKLEIHGEAYC